MAKKKTGSTASREAASSVDLAELERILGFMAEHGLEELEYQSGDLHVRLRKPGEAVASFPAAHRGTANPGPAAAPAGHSHAASAAPPDSSVSPASPGEILHIVKSPIVGTFYEAPSPGSPPFVQVGDVVKPGQILCIVEAMKLMNEIEADQGGEVVRRAVENGQPVEYGQALFALRPVAEA